MSNQSLDDLIYFNGLNLETGGYFDEPMTVGELAAIANQHRPDKKSLSELESKKSETEASFGVPIEFGLGDDLKKVGWGMIFPAQADAKQVDAILAAMKDLVELRQGQAGNFFKILRGKDGYRWSDGRGETKSEFLERFKLGPGEFRPKKMPFYLLIVADPQSIPFSFQHELDVQYAVGRIYFQTLQEYATYAHSVVQAETGKVKLRRRSVFFGVGNQNDKATSLSVEHLIQPLHNHTLAVSEENDLGWESILVKPEDALKENLRQQLGGGETPAIFFSASHGIGWPYNHKLQLETQGGLVCQDWRRFDPQEKPMLKHILTAKEIPDTANLLGSMVFPFACFGLGTPYKDEFAIAKKNQERIRLAPRPFLSPLPVRLLGHPNGGALAVIGHVERAWPHSFQWGELQSTTGAFESLLTNLMQGMPVGLAMDRMNLRYAEIATTLADNLKELAFDENFITPFELTYQWTANNDARGYAILGDPAARLSLAPPKAKKDTRLTITLSGDFSGALPVVFSPPALEALDGDEQQMAVRESETLQALAGPFSAAVEAEAGGGAAQEPAADEEDAASLEIGGGGGRRPPADQPVADQKAAGRAGSQVVVAYASPFDGLAAAVQIYGPEASFGLGDDLKQAISPILTNLNSALQSVAATLKQAADNIATLEVSTSVVDDLDHFDAKKAEADQVSRRYMTTITLTGDINLYLPGDMQGVDEVLLELHSEMVKQAQANRMEMIKTLGEMVASLFGAKS